MKPASLYAAFDTYPAPKGAATHIRYMAQTLFEFFGGGYLYTLGGESLPRVQHEENIHIVRFSQRVPNLLERAIAFGEDLTKLLQQQGDTLKLCHLRDPWGGLPIINYRVQHNSEFKTVYEVNSLPSIELPYAFPHIAASTLNKIGAQEEYCLTHCDIIITPSRTTQALLYNKGIAKNKVKLIPNGAELKNGLVRPKEAPAQYIIYFGAIQRWQGVDELLRAFAQLADYPALRLVMCVAKHNRIAKQYRKMAEKLGIAERVVWQFALPQEALFPWVQHALLSLAPLTDCSRNRLQGCCPLKILESMALGTPVVASDLPAVRELVNSEHACLVRPGRHGELAMAMRCLLEEPEALKSLGEHAQQHIKHHFSWQQACRSLTNVYTECLKS